MNKIYTYLFFYSFSILGFSVFSQDLESKKDLESKSISNDTLPPGEKYGLRVGIDASRIIRSFTSDDYEGVEFIADYRIYRKFYVALEIGNELLERDEENINVEGSGSYFRLGFDYNSYNNWYGMQNLIFVGLRYGLSTFDQQLNSFRIFTGSSIFPNREIISGQKNDNLTANWISLIVGLKVETIKNLYLGANIALRRLSNQKRPDGFDNLFIPGFGQTNDFSKFNVGYSYTISYLIPFQKKKK